MEIGDIGRFVLIAGIGLVVIGIVLIVVGRIPGLGNLPGDISFQRGGTTFYFPLATMLILSLLLTLILNILLRR